MWRLLDDFAVEVDVETLDLDLLGDPQTDDHVDDLEDDERARRRPDDGREDAVELVQTWPALPSSRPGLAADRLDGEDAGQDRADEAADGVDAEGVERVVIAEARASARPPPRSR